MKTGKIINNKIKVENKTNIQDVIGELGCNFDNPFEAMMEIIDNATAIPFCQKPKVDIYIKEVKSNEEITLEFHDYIGGISPDKLSDVISIKKNENGQKGVNEHGFGLKNAISFFDKKLKNATLYTRTKELKAKRQYVKYDLTFANQSEAEIITGSVFDNSEASTIIQIRNININRFPQTEEKLYEKKSIFYKTVKWICNQFNQRYHDIDVNIFYREDGGEYQQMPFPLFDPNNFFDKENYYTFTCSYCNIILSRKNPNLGKKRDFDSSFFEKRYPIIISNGRRFIAKFTLKEIGIKAYKANFYSNNKAINLDETSREKIKKLLGCRDVFVLIIIKEDFPETTTFKQQLSSNGKQKFFYDLKKCDGIAFINSHLSSNEKKYADFIKQNPQTLEASEKQIAVSQDIDVQNIFGNVQKEYPVFKTRFVKNTTSCSRIDAFVSYKEKNIAFEWKNPQISASTKFLSEINHYARGFFLDTGKKIDYFVLVTNGEESEEMKNHFFLDFDKNYIERLYLIKKIDLIKTCEEIKNEIIGEN